MSSISSTNPVSNALASDYSSLADAVAGSSGDFSSLFSQAMSAATTPSQQAQVAFDETEYSNVNVLSSMADGSSSDSSDFSSLANLASLLGDNPTTPVIPAWETDLADLLGPSSTAAQALNLDQQASLLSQSMLNGDLNSLGSSIDSLM
ncbi:MAG TPA: hypothetical protein VN963_02120 [bacterium]|nr:hypothetical protein [bacterium]